MNLLIHDIAAAIEREADDEAARRAGATGPLDPMTPWQEAAGEAGAETGEDPGELRREQR